MKKDFVLPIIVLSVISLFVSGVLAMGYGMTQPVIEAAASQRAEIARKEVIPQADGFVLLELEGLPKRITDVYGTTNNVGFVFMISTVGYGGEIKLICGIDPEGKIIKTATLSQTETKGIATKVFDQEARYIGKDKKLEGTDAISGATITSNAYKNGIREAFEAFEIVKGTQL